MSFQDFVCSQVNNGYHKRMIMCANVEPGCTRKQRHNLHVSRLGDVVSTKSVRVMDLVLPAMSRAVTVQFLLPSFNNPSFWFVGQIDEDFV